MSSVKKHFDLLGHQVKDKVTNFVGIVSSVTFDLYGCIQAIVNPGVDKDGKPRQSEWFDVNRLEVLSTKPVLPAPSFDWTPEAVAAGRKGPAERPAHTPG